MMSLATPPLNRRILLSIALLATGGVLVSSVSLYHHYGTSATSYCDIGENFNCDIVNRSTYSTMRGNAPSTSAPPRATTDPLQ